MVEPVTILTGLALVKKSVDFVKQQIETCNDIGDIIGHIDKAMTGEQQLIKARNKSGADPFAIGTVAQEIIDVKIARENLNELKNLVNLRFGHGTWEFILQERKKRIDAQKQAIKEEKARRLKKRQEIEEYIKYGFITIAVILFLGVAVAVTMKFFVSVSQPIHAHEMEYDDGSCLVYNPKWWLMCLNEGREITDTELYLQYKKEQNNWIIKKD
tara:strand:+ start:566 stop:1207 length:642 start_codon:yes stop_codon:yes gene_type:complete